MSSGSVMSTVLKSSPYLARMSLDVFWMYVTLGRRVRKTRRAFERQLIMAGMPETDAKRVSFCFEELKNGITGMLKQGMVGSLSSVRIDHA